MDRNEDPVAPWDTPEFKAKRGTNTEDENKRQEVETLFDTIKQAVSLPPPVIDWDALTPKYERHEMDGVNVLTHTLSKCQGRKCVIHNPSDHHMRGWPKRFHQPTQQTARVCKHGLGHPDPDDVAYWQQIAHRRISTKHECDGCCTPTD